MINLKIGGILLVVGAALFVLSDTLFGDTDAAAYSAFFGLIMFPGGLILVLVGIVQVIVVRIKDRQK
jgi:predicted phage tail protein